MKSKLFLIVLILGFNVFSMENTDNTNVRKKLESLYHLPLPSAAEKFGESETVFKKICRQHGIEKWPFRKIKSIDTMIVFSFYLLDISISTPERNRNLVSLADLHAKRDKIIENPNLIYQDLITKKELQSFSKKYGRKEKEFRLWVKNGGLGKEILLNFTNGNSIEWADNKSQPQNNNNNLPNDADLERAPSGFVNLNPASFDKDTIKNYVDDIDDVDDNENNESEEKSIELVKEKPVEPKKVKKNRMTDNPQDKMSINYLIN